MAAFWSDALNTRSAYNGGAIRFSTRKAFFALKELYDGIRGKTRGR